MADPSIPTTRPGSRTIVAGSYEADLGQPLGSGGMALVYAARDLRTGEIVALKTLRPEYRSNAETRARFRREARTMAFLEHPNVAKVHDLWEDDEAPWAVLEFVPGPSLKELVQHDGPLAPEQVADILDQVADALGHLHDQGLVHLDVKPQNLIMTEDETVKLIDFGLAQMAGQPQEMIGGLAFGTAAYLAPEQAAGDAVGPRSDIYSLGCVVYELLTGTPPFSSADGNEPKHEVIQAHLNDRPPAPSERRPDLQIPAWADDAVLWALAKRPDSRYGDVRDFSAVFRSGVDGSEPDIDWHPTAPIPDDIIETWEAEPLPRRRRGRRLSRLLWRLCLGLLLVNLGLAAAHLYRTGTIPGTGISLGSSQLERGGDAVVTMEGLNFRAEPGLNGPTVLTLTKGTPLLVSGDRLPQDGEWWWPVVVTWQGGDYAGWVWEAGIEPRQVTGEEWLEEQVGIDLPSIPD